MRQYSPSADPTDKFSVAGYYNASMVVALLKSCGDNLTRQNILTQATHMQQVQIPMLLPGIRLTTSPDDYSPIKQNAATTIRRTGLGKTWRHRWGAKPLTAFRALL